MRVARDHLGALWRRRVASVSPRAGVVVQKSRRTAQLVRSSFCLAKRLQAFIVQPDKSPSLTWWQRQDAAEAVSNTGRIKGV